MSSIENSTQEGLSGYPNLEPCTNESHCGKMHHSEQMWATLGFVHEYWQKHDYCKQAEVFIKVRCDIAKAITSQNHLKMTFRNRLCITGWLLHKLAKNFPAFCSVRLFSLGRRQQPDGAWKKNDSTLLYERMSLENFFFLWCKWSIIPVM